MANEDVRAYEALVFLNEGLKELIPPTATNINRLDVLMRDAYERVKTALIEASRSAS